MGFAVLQKSRSCHALGQCVDTLGGYKCECKEGYYGDGVKSCVLANECELGIHKCHKTWATCVNTRQSYECHCKKGFEGDGRTCKDIDECAKKQHKCNLKIKGVECLNTDGSYKCVCGKGFSGDGKQCVDIDECKLGSHNCVKDAICVNLDGRFSCKCREGFWGDGTKKCERKHCIEYAIDTKLLLHTVLIDKSFLVAKRWKFIYPFNMLLSTPLGAFLG